jgi:hypothetical protein
MAKEIRLAIQKNIQEGEHALSSTSPVSESATSASKIAIKKTTLLAYSKLLANKSISTVAQELKADGNERMAVELSNMANAANIIVSVASTKGLALIPMTISSVAQQVVRYRSAARETKIAEVERRLKGQRSNFSQGSVHFD